MAEADSEALDSADIMRIMELLPHRYPFLLIDRIEDLNQDISCTGIKNVTINEPFFAGHFPQKPVMPGVLLIEAMAQTAGALVLNHHASQYAGSIVYFMAIDKARFRRPVGPGDQVLLPVQKLQQRKTAWRFSAKAMVGGKVNAEAEVTAMLMPGS